MRCTHKLPPRIQSLKFDKLSSVCKVNNSFGDVHFPISCLASTQQQLPMSFYFALAGGTMPFIRRYSTIWP